MALQYIKLFGDFNESTEALTDEEVGHLIRALVAYFNGEPYTLNGNERYIFPAFKLQIDRDKAAYDEISEKRKAAGSKGGKQRQANEANACNCEHLQTKPCKSKQDKDQDKDQDKEKDEDKDEVYNAAAACPDFDTVEVYAANNLRSLSPGNMAELASFLEDIPEELVRHAIDEACAAGAPCFNYARAVMQRYVECGFKTLGDAKAAGTVKKPQPPSIDRNDVADLSTLYA